MPLYVETNSKALIKFLVTIVTFTFHVLNKKGIEMTDLIVLKNVMQLNLHVQAEVGRIFIFTVFKAFKIDKPL